MKIGFWLFMLVIDLIIPLTMFGLGGSFLKKPPKEINSSYGYRTSRSMKNRDTWEFAHHYVGKLWRMGGLVSIPVSIIVMLFAFGKDYHTVGIVSLALTIVQSIFMAATIFPTEKALKKNFDSNGNRY